MTYKTPEQIADDLADKYLRRPELSVAEGKINGSEGAFDDSVPPPQGEADYGLPVNDEPTIDRGSFPARTTTRSTAALKFEMRMLDEIEVRDDPPALVQGLLPVGPAFGVCFGPPKSFKSFLLLDVTLHIAAFPSYCGRKVQNGAAVYITSEGVRGAERRAIAGRRRLSLEGKGVPFVLVTTMPNLGAGPDDREALKKAIKDKLAAADITVPIAMIVIDTLRRATPGKSENKTEDMSVFVENCESVAREFSCLVMTVHHSPRSDETHGSGSNAIDAAADVMWRVSRQEGSNRATATVDEFKDGAEGDTWEFELRPVEIGTDRDGNAITTCHVEIVLEPEHRAPSKTGVKPLSPAQHRVYDIVVAAVTKNGIVDAAGDAAPKGTRAVTRDIAKQYARQLGFWDDTDDKADKSSRAKWSGRLTELAGKHAIGLTATHLWIARAP